MKNILLFILGMFLITSCAKDNPTTYPVEKLTDTQEEFETMLLDKNNTNLVIAKYQAGEVKPLGAVVAFGGAPRSSDISYTIEVVEQSAADGLSISNTGTIPTGELKGLIPIDVELDKFELGVANTISVKLTESDASNTDETLVEYTFTVVCPSDLAGEYDANSVGLSTDDCCPDEVNSVGTVTITGGDGAYTISDFSGGMYFDWYSAYGITEDFETDGRLNISIGDVCGTLSGSGQEPFQTEVTLTGIVNPDTGVITYTWVNGYDDTATVTLTPK